jgi:hypothetical protein
MRNCLLVLAGLCFLVSLMWIGAILNAERVCYGLPPDCGGPGRGDVLMGPLLFSIVGLPATIVSVIIIVVVIVRALLRLRAPKQKDSGGQTM